jgi:hypothetical protein
VTNLGQRDEYFMRQRNHVPDNFRRLRLREDLELWTRAIGSQRAITAGLIGCTSLHHAVKEPVLGLGMIEELGRHGYTLSPGTLYPILQARRTAVCGFGRGARQRICAARLSADRRAGLLHMASGVSAKPRPSGHEPPLITKLAWHRGVSP